MLTPYLFWPKSFVVQKEEKAYRPAHMKGTWEKIQSNLEKSLKSGIFQVWIKPLQGEMQEDTLDLKAPSEFVASWVRERLTETIKQEAAHQLGYIPSLNISGNGHSPNHSVDAAPKTREQRISLPMDYSYQTKKKAWRYVFDDFVVGDSNRLAYTACSSMCNMNFPADHIFICSGPGLGKTHLLQAIGHFFYKKYSQEPLKVMYVSSEQFANQLVRAIKSKKVDEFKRHYRDNIDLLLLEDIHFFQGKEKMQEELLSIIKSLESQGNKFVFSSSFLPKELNKIDQKLTSYFCSGVLAPIDKPDYDFRFLLIQKKAKKYDLALTSKIEDLIARKITSDIRQIESCIQNIALKSQMLREKVSDDLVREVLQNYSQEQESLDIDQIIQSICKAFEISLEKLRSKTRKKQVVMARNTAFYLARKHTDLSLKNIGQYLNRRHSTVLKGITNVERELGQESHIGRQLIKVVEAVESRS